MLTHRDIDRIAGWNLSYGLLGASASGNAPKRRKVFAFNPVELHARAHEERRKVPRRMRQRRRSSHAS